MNKKTENNILTIIIILTKYLINIGTVLVTGLTQSGNTEVIVICS